MNLVHSREAIFVLIFKYIKEHSILDKSLFSDVIKIVKQYPVPGFSDARFAAMVTMYCSGNFLLNLEESS